MGSSFLFPLFSLSFATLAMVFQDACRLLLSTLIMISFLTNQLNLNSLRHQFNLYSR
jgi:hypothetical protein